jgi:hypothetical protein
MRGLVVPGVGVAVSDAGSSSDGVGADGAGRVVGVEVSDGGSSEEVAVGCGQVGGRCGRWGRRVEGFGGAPVNALTGRGGGRRRDERQEGVRGWLPTRANVAIISASRSPTRSSWGSQSVAGSRRGARLSAEVGRDVQRLG